MIKGFVVDDATGVTASTFEVAAAENLAGVLLQPGQRIVVYDGEGEIAQLETWLDDGELKIRPRTVDSEMEMVAAIAEARRRIFAVRDICEWRGCETAKGRVDTDEASQRKINGKCLEAIAASYGGIPGWSVDWTMADNQVVPHNADEMIAMALAVSAHVSAAHVASQQAKAIVEAQDNPGAVLAIADALETVVDWPGMMQLPA
jgi:hypothetical protein